MRLGEGWLSISGSEHECRYRGYEDLEAKDDMRANR